MTTASRILIGMVSGVGVIAGAAMSTSAHDRASETICEVTLTAIPGGTRLEARVLPRAAMTGSYALKVREKGRSGSASIDQSGEFSASRDTVLSEIELSTAGRQLHTEFTLRSGGKTYVCPLRAVPTSL